MLLLRLEWDFGSDADEQRVEGVLLCEGWIGKGAWRVRERSFEWRRGCGRVERGTWPAGVERCGDAGSVLV